MNQMQEVNCWSNLPMASQKENQKAAKSGRVIRPSPNEEVWCQYLSLFGYSTGLVHINTLFLPKNSCKIVVQ